MRIPGKRCLRLPGSRYAVDPTDEVEIHRFIFTCQGQVLPKSGDSLPLLKNYNCPTLNSAVASRLEAAQRPPTCVASSWTTTCETCGLSLDWSCTRIRRVGSNSGGTPKRTGNVEEKGNPRRSISWALPTSVGRTASDGLQFGARRSANACGECFDA